MIDLGGRPVLLSASIPTEDRRGESGANSPTEIANAVSAVARTILMANGNVLCGGHPTITPILLWIAREFPPRGAITVYQSEFFRDHIPPETTELAADGFGEVVWSPSGGAQDPSLQIMRDSMIQADLTAAVYIGGMSGIAQEFDFVQRKAPSALQVPLVAPGGAARRLLGQASLRGALRDAVQTRRYPYVASLIVEAIDEMIN